MAERIEDYALIGDTETVALVSRQGSIDWLCAPRFDSPACFAALLGNEDHGRWSVAPVGPAGTSQVERRYRGDTLVLETVHTTATGSVAVIDFMPIRGMVMPLLTTGRATAPAPEHETEAGASQAHGAPADLVSRDEDGQVLRYPSIIRIVEGRTGTVAMRTEVALRFDYGNIVPWVRADDGGFSAVGGADGVVLRSDVELVGQHLRHDAEFTVAAGERVHFSLSWFPSHFRPPPAFDCELTRKVTEKWWDRWSDHCGYEGPWRDAIVRSLITLKGLTYAPTGGIVAAATTSLPEWVGSVRNWDYRYCWLRDATFTLSALLDAGYGDEASAWSDWLRRAVAGSPDKMQIMYGVGGERRLTEYTIDWLPGYEDSAPVRVGNAASDQFQLDVYG